jgi:hypothetical protein
MTSGTQRSTVSYPAQETGCAWNTIVGDMVYPTGSLPQVQSFLKTLQATQSIPQADAKTLLFIFPQAFSAAHNSFMVSFDEDAHHTFMTVDGVPLFGHKIQNYRG